MKNLKNPKEADKVCLQKMKGKLEMPRIYFKTTPFTKSTWKMSKLRNSTTVPMIKTKRCLSKRELSATLHSKEGTIL